MAVAGLRREEWTGASYTDDEFRELAEVVPGVPFFGTGGLGERIWSGPAITVTGIDVLPVDKAVNAVVPYARAKVSLRVHPEQDPAEAQAALVRHLEELQPFGVSLTVHAAETGKGFAAKTTGPAYEAAREALAARLGQRDGVASPRAARSRSSARCRRRRRTPRCCCSARRTASRTSTRRTSACCVDEFEKAVARRGGVLRPLRRARASMSES